MFLRIRFYDYAFRGYWSCYIKCYEKENEELSNELRRKKMGYVSMLGWFISDIFFMWYMGTLPDNAHAVFAYFKR
jgi:hypothetical protein